jgi:ABC-type nitrate/sulfonate/bicarbonate transport system permease component
LKIRIRNLLLLNPELRRGLLSIAGGLALWEVLTRLLLKRAFDPISSVIAALWNLTVSGKLTPHIQATLFEFILRFHQCLHHRCCFGLSHGHV